MKDGSAVIKWKDATSGSAEKLVGWDEKHLLTAYFAENLSAKYYKNRLMYVEVIARRRWNVFLGHSVLRIKIHTPQ